MMEEVSPEKLMEIIEGLNTNSEKYFTETSFTRAKVIIIPEWCCPLCITRFEGESWGLQAMICDTRESEDSNAYIFIAPLGFMSPAVEKAIGYLKVVTLMNELEDQNDFNVQQIIDTIGRNNANYAMRTIKPESVKG